MCRLNEHVRQQGQGQGQAVGFLFWKSMNLMENKTRFFDFFYSLELLGRHGALRTEKDR